MILLKKNICTFIYVLYINYWLKKYSLFEYLTLQYIYKTLVTNKICNNNLNFLTYI